MKNILISFIIPIYNGEKYIERIVESILKENKNNIEIILLNDGSTDNSETILNSYKNNKLIRIINKANTGVSDTRNIGLKEAKGKYIMFADCDDFYCKGFLDKISFILNKNQFDLLIFSALEEDKDGNLKTIFKQEDNKEIAIKNCGLNGYILGDYTMRLGDCIWNKVYKSSIIKENNILFKTDQRIAEDKLFNIEYMEYIENMYNLSDSLYIYCYNENSVTRKYRSNFLSEYLKIGNNLKDISEKVKYKDYAYLISNFYLQSTGFIMYNEVLSNNKKESIKQLKKYFSNPIFVVSLKEINIFQLSFKNIMKYFMIKMKLYGLIYRFIFFKERKK